MTMRDTSSRQLVAALQAVECPAFAHRRETRAGADVARSEPIMLAHGEGSVMVDVDGRRYIDLIAGFGAVSLGHGHPLWRKAVDAQLARLTQGLGDVYASDVKLALLQELAGLHHDGDARVLLCQSGADAVTAAIKTATLATGRHAIVAFDGGYHGLGYAPLATCGFQQGFRAPFAPQLNPKVSFAPYPGVRGASQNVSLEVLRGLLRAEKVAAVVIEPVIGRGGCVAPPRGFLREVSRLAQHHGALVIADEIWVGMGRAGSMVCSASEIDADLLCFGKGLGGGLPISACVGSGEVMSAWAKPHSALDVGGKGGAVHTSTHAGLPLACAAALATLGVIRDQGLAERAAELGERLLERWQRELASSPQVVAVRGAGLMVGIELRDAGEAQRAIAGLLQRGYLVISGGVHGDTLTLTPALTIEEDHLAGFAPALCESLAASTAQSVAP